jgi:sec-independent protein translocase protein TatA
MLARAFEGWHLVIIAVVVLILFGSKKLPDAARSFGRSLRILKAETKGLRDDKDDEADPGDEREQARHVPPALPPGRNTTAAADAEAAAESRRDER